MCYNNIVHTVNKQNHSGTATSYLTWYAHVVWRMRVVICDVRSGMSKKKKTNEWVYIYKVKRMAFVCSVHNKWLDNKNAYRAAFGHHAWHFHKSLFAVFPSVLFLVLANSWLDNRKSPWEQKSRNIPRLHFEFGRKYGGY